jgi:hypothetical protein
MNQKATTHQRKVKATFDKGTKKDVFNEGNLVLRWDARREEKEKTW